jgi:hypothetical protein
MKLHNMHDLSQCSPRWADAASSWSISSCRLVAVSQCMDRSTIASSELPTRCGKESNLRAATPEKTAKKLAGEPVTLFSEEDGLCF